MQPLVLQRILFKQNGALWETLPMFEYSIASTSWLLGITMTMNQTANCLIRVYSLGFNFYKKTDESPALLPTSPLLSSIRCTNGGKQAVSGLWGKEYKSFSLRISLYQCLNCIQSRAPIEFTNIESYSIRRQIESNRIE